MYKILIADDEALMRKGLCTLIDWAKLGCQIVGTAENGRQAKQAVLDYQPDIIIADIKMPVMDGLELARWVCGCTAADPDHSADRLCGFFPTRSRRSSTASATTLQKREI